MLGRLMNVHVLLRVREGNSFLVEAFLDGFREPEIDCPIVRRLDPGAHYKIDGAISKFRHRDKAGGIFKNSIIRVD